ncbi:MAG: GIY-YIG nuclease family protein [Polaromonas sp.]|nr:GIY-YIG nuclease family protein [Polaromonas sp.]MDP3753449.1 GIY-YIG nuclease family protein [Polaromonas sp.]
MASVPFSPHLSAPASVGRTRSELKKQYRETPPPMGVYAIRSLSSGRVIVEASMNVHAAMNRARFELDHKSHRDKLLQQDWLTLGPDNCRFEVIDLVKRRDDPAFDYKAELAGLLTMWREELGV